MYKVIVADNYHYMDEGESFASGKFATIEDAIIKCKLIVDDYLLSAFQPGMTSDDLYDNYQSFGEDPYIEGENIFSAWAYAKKKCIEICLN